MRPDRTRDIVANAILVGLVFGGVIYWQTRDLVQVIPAAAIMAVSIYFGSLASNRIARRIARRISPPAVEGQAIQPLEASTDRPEHVQRRRSRRRPRGRRS